MDAPPPIGIRRKSDPEIVKHVVGWDLGFMPIVEEMHAIIIDILVDRSDQSPSSMFQYITLLGVPKNQITFFTIPKPHRSRTPSNRCRKTRTCAGALQS
jgi:hypothetical protein